MGNNYFQFRQFKIEQDRCAMKVSTDACIQGAWTPVLSRIKTALDIGTGTGLLSLMLAQRNAVVKIDAIEIDPSAAEQAAENIVASPWQERITLIQADVRQYIFAHKYDLIICNPPFFVNSLLSDKRERNIARHNLSLSFQDLFDVIKGSLNPEGYASVLLPSTEHKIWKSLVEANGWAISRELHIIPRIGQAANRVVSLCTDNKAFEFTRQSVVIRNELNEYKPEFTELLSPFYLKFRRYFHS
jgi:tRNA1Val (adenine37-N6)-methyltransferase